MLLHALNLIIILIISYGIGMSVDLRYLIFLVELIFGAKSII
jgi:hypothetical protein